MVNNNLYKVENTLRSIAKRYKSVKYSLGLAILFLMMGVSAFSEEVVAQEAVAQQEVMTTEQIATSKENLRNSVESLQTKVSDARRENQKEIDGLRLELVKFCKYCNKTHQGMSGVLRTNIVFHIFRQNTQHPRDHKS